jgi:hypothetical protein
VTIPWEEHRLVRGFLVSNMWKIHVKVVSVHMVPPQAAQMKMWRKLADLSVKILEVPFWRLLAG